MRKFSILALMLLGVGIAGSAAYAATPTPAQQSAIKAACPGDFQSYCAGVSPGGSAALSCLEKNVAKLSSACQTAVNAVIGGGAAARRAGGNRPCRDHRTGRHDAPRRDHHGAGGNHAAARHHRADAAPGAQTRPHLLRRRFPDLLQQRRPRRRPRHRLPRRARPAALCDLPRRHRGSGAEVLGTVIPQHTLVVPGAAHRSGALQTRDREGVIHLPRGSGSRCATAGTTVWWRSPAAALSPPAPIPTAAHRRRPRRNRAGGG